MMRTQDRYVVVKPSKDGTCQRRTYTDFFDAAVITKRCSRNRAKKPCFLLQGPIGAEKLIGKCAATRCTKQLTATDNVDLQACRTGVSKKKARKALIAAQVKKRRLTPHHLTTSKASKSGVFERKDLPPELQGRKRKTHKRRRR
jgi:hypothetical protein